MEKTHPSFQIIIAFISDVLLCVVAIFLSVMMYYGMLETKSDSMTTSVLGWQFLSRGIYFLLLLFGDILGGRHFYYSPYVSLASAGVFLVFCYGFFNLSKEQGRIFKN